MDCLTFDKSKLVNLEQSLTSEIIRSNQVGCYLSTTLSGCNTRKYHGLLIAPSPIRENEKNVLLSSLDETIIQHGAEFNLGLHKYTGEHYEPNGHKYMREVIVSDSITTYFRVGGVILKREYLLMRNKEQLLIKYTLKQAHSETRLRLKPFLAFRNIHALCHQNDQLNTSYTSINNGIMCRPYNNRTKLYLQLSKSGEFVAQPNWYNNIEYFKEKDRGYNYQEDLYVPGYFELPIKQGETIIFSASTRQVDVKGLRIQWGREEKRKYDDETFVTSLQNAADHFVQKKKDKVNIIAGYHWYDCLTRQTFISLPGIIDPKQNKEDYEATLDTQLKNLKNGLFPLISTNADSTYASIDTPLWFFYAVQQYGIYNKNSKYLWDKYGEAMKQIISAYVKGTNFDIKLYDGGLIGSSYTQTPLTWMDSMTDGKQCVQRMEVLVEINALWYNALSYALELATESNDNKFINEYKSLKTTIAESFINAFWFEENGYLADGVNDNQTKDWTIRPNMVIAAAMPFSPLNREQKKNIISIAKRLLLTPRGLRSLSPGEYEYKGFMPGNATAERELIIHKGAAWPWLMQFFVDAYLQVHQRGGIAFVKKILEDFEGAIVIHGIGTISEMYNGNPPHMPKGAVSHAGSVASIIRIAKLIEEYELNEEQHKKPNTK